MEQLDKFKPAPPTGMEAPSPMTASNAILTMEKNVPLDIMDDIDMLYSPVRIRTVLYGAQNKRGAD